MKDTDIFWKGSNAVNTSRIWLAIFSWIFIIIGIPMLLLGGDTKVACILIGVGISGLILSGVLRGFNTIVKASEAYLKDREDKIESEKAE